MEAEKQSYENGSIQGYGILRLSQEEANYQPYGFTEQQGCATCRWFNGYDNRCHVVDGVIATTGKSDLYSPIRPQEQLQELMEDFTEAMQEAGLEVEIEAEAADMEMKQKKPSLLARFFGSRKQTPQEPPLFPTDTGFKVISDGDQDMWIAWYTNSYKDRDGEWFSEKSIENDVAFMQETGKLPELWFYHMKGTRHGEAATVAKIGRFAVAIGTFDNTPLADAFKAHYRKEDHLLSHGFYYNDEDRKDHVYEWHHTFEVSPLPPKSAANPFTPYVVALGEKTMQSFTENQKAALKKAVGDELAAKIIEQGEKMTTTLDNAGVAYKSSDGEQQNVSGDVKELTTLVKSLAESVQALHTQVTEMKAAKPPADEEDDDEAEKKPEDEKARADQSGMQDMFKDLFSDFVNNHQKQIEQRETGQKMGADALMDMLLPAAQK